VRLWLRLFSCATAIEKRLRRNLSERYGTTLPRFDALAALDRRPDGMMMSELSDALLVSNGNVTLLVQALKADGHVDMARSPSDRRASIVSLTPKGKAHFAELAQAHHAWLDEMFDGFGPDERDALHQLLGALKRQVGEGRA
jgi:DNA-binding MarR family transcriptional regulator